MNETTPCNAAARALTLGAFAFCMACGITGAASGQTVALNGDDVVTARFLSGWRMENGHHMAAVEISLAQGWKTYWRSPGDGGLAPELRIERNAQIAAAWMHFPRPEVIFTAGTPNIGYHDHVVFPIELAMPRGLGPMPLSAELSIGVCDEICMPITLELEGILPDRGARDPMILQALADQPTPAAEAGVGPARCAIRPISDGLQVSVEVTAPDLGAPETMMLELPLPDVWMSPPAFQRNAGQITATADLVPPQGLPFSMERSDLRITLVGSHRAIEIEGCVAH